MLQQALLESLKSNGPFADQPPITDYRPPSDMENHDAAEDEDMNDPDIQEAI